MSKPRILVVFYSMYGHIYEMTKQVAAGITEAGGEAVVKRTADLIPDKYLDEYAMKFKDSIREIPEADPRADLSGIDGIIIGTPTRFGNMTAQMKNFLDQTGGDWLKGTLIGKPAAVFTSTATQHGGQETTLITSMIPLLHHGCVIVGLPYSNQEQMSIESITGGSPYGASTIAGGRGERLPTDDEKKMARALGAHVTRIAAKLK